MGFVVMDEAFDCWRSQKDAERLSACSSTTGTSRTPARCVRRDRNHPSVIMWSIGNEIGEQGQGGDSNVANELAAIVHAKTRPAPITAA